MIVEDIRNITKLDFTNFSIGSKHPYSRVMALKENPKNSQFGKSIEILCGFVKVDYSSLAGKFEFPFLEPKQIVIDFFYNEVLPIIPRGVFKGIIALFILKYTKVRSISKPQLASIALQNFIFDIPEIFRGQYQNQNFIYLALDITRAFKSLENERECLCKTIKEEFNKVWSTKEANHFHLNVYRSIINKKYGIWGRKEHRRNLVFFLKNAKHYHQNIVDESSYFQHALCVEFVKYVIDTLQKEEAKQYLVDQLSQKLIEHCLTYCDKTSVQIGTGILQEARDFAQVRKMSNDIIERIDKKLMSFNRELQKSFASINLEIPQEHIESLNRIKNDIKDDIVNYKMPIHRIIRKYIWDLSINLNALKNKQPVFADYLASVYFDRDGRKVNSHEAGSIFQNYKICIKAYSLTCETLIETILEHFYPQTFDFADLVLYNPIVPEGYGEMVCRALYAGVQKDDMDFLIYCTYSFEAILRHILTSNGHLAINPNRMGRQDYKTFENVLKEIESNKLVKSELIEELFLIFTDKGFNLRNDVAHATLSIYHFYGYFYLRSYLWCFLVRFLILGISNDLGEEIKNNR